MLRSWGAPQVRVLVGTSAAAPVRRLRMVSKHRNVVQFYGFSGSRIVTELMEVAHPLHPHFPRPRPSVCTARHPFRAEFALLRTVAPSSPSQPPPPQHQQTHLESTWQLVVAVRCSNWGAAAISAAALGGRPQLRARRGAQSEASPASCRVATCGTRCGPTASCTSGSAAGAASH